MIYFWEVSYPKRNIEIISFDFVKQAVSIQLKSGKIYQIAIKDTEKIKEEIEKRMIVANDKSQY